MCDFFYFKIQFDRRERETEPDRVYSVVVVAERDYSISAIMNIEQDEAPNRRALPF